MPVTKRSLSQLRHTVSRHLRRGFVRAVFSRPGGEDDERVEGATGGAPPDAAALAELLARSTAAAEAGRVKQTFVIDERTRVVVDARHGGGKLVTVDDARASKQMGGKARALHPERSGALLQLIGIMNPDGTISAKHAKKYKQVSHFVELCRPICDALAQRAEAAPLRVLDLGCGNGYLTFVLAEALRLAELPAVVHGVDLRTDVIERCRERAAVLAATPQPGAAVSLSFSCTSIADSGGAAALLGGAPDLVMALHACDTATCDALALAIEAAAPAILVAPCCQHELAGQLERDKDTLRTLSPAIASQGLLRQDFAATLTDALRVEILTALGWSVDVLEFVDDSHTPKNLLLRARLVHAVRDRSVLEPIARRCASLGVMPRLLQRLRAPAGLTPPMP